MKKESASARGTRLGFQRISIAVLLIAVIAVGVLAAFQWRAFRHSRLQSEYALSFIETSRALMTQMVNAETGERGFAITRQQDFLAPFPEAGAAIPAILTQLKTMAADAPDQVARLDRIADMWRQRSERLASVIALTREGRADAARNAILTGRGKALMDQLRGEIDQLVEQQQHMLSTRLAAVDAEETATRWTMIAAFAIAIATLLAALVITNGDRKKLADLVTAERRTAVALEEAHEQLTSKASQTQLELRDASRLLAAAVSSAPILLWSQDKNLVYRWFHGRPLGLDPEIWIGRSDQEALPESIRDTVMSNNMAALESGKPRTYELCYRGRRGEKWYDIHIEPTFAADGAIEGLTGVAVDITERKKREQNNRLLMREISHRSKNILAVVQAMARQTATTTPEPQAFVERFAARLEALGATHALLVDEGWTGADLLELIRSQLAHQLDQQVFTSGPPLKLPSDASQNIGLALHELATNAAKYGALSTPSGRVDIVWTVTPAANGESWVQLSWKETGGPPVQAPKRKGFGQVVIERTVSRALNGTVDINYDPQGLSWRLRFPLAPDDEDRASAHSA